MIMVVRVEPVEDVLYAILGHQGNRADVEKLLDLEHGVTAQRQADWLNLLQKFSTEYKMWRLLGLRRQCQFGVLRFRLTSSWSTSQSPCTSIFSHLQRPP